MRSTSQSGDITADVKCYFCGHISGQIVARRNEPIRPGNFVPRPGYKGAELKPGMRLRCERCGGPVFLEDAAPLTLPRPVVDIKVLMEERTPKKRKAA
jgi:hypothetical protein